MVGPVVKWTTLRRTQIPCLGARMPDRNRRRESTAAHLRCSVMKSDFNRVIHSVNNLPFEVWRAELAPAGAETALNPLSPPGYPQLWISCGYRGVAKWITYRRGTTGRKNARVAARGVAIPPRGLHDELIHRESTLLITHSVVIPAGTSAGKALWVPQCSGKAMPGSRRGPTVINSVDNFGRSCAHRRGS